MFTEQVLVVNQKAKLMGSKVGYSVFNPSGQQVGTVEELRRELSKALSDKVLGRSAEAREHRYRLVDTSERVVLEMTRPRLGFFH